MMTMKEPVKQVEHKFRELSFENLLKFENVLIVSNENDGGLHRLYRYLSDDVVLMYALV